MAGPRQSNPIDMQVAPGLYMQRSARQSAGRYIDGDNVRWYQNLPQKMGGFQEKFLADTNGNSVWYKGHARSCHQWDSLDSQNWIAFGTEYKLYLINNDRLYDITPIRKTTTIVGGFSTTVGQLTVLVHDPSHDAQAGDFVTYSGGTPIGNFNPNQEWQITSVLDLDNYVLTLDVPASTSATGGGSVLAQYQINIGLTSDGTLTGYGTGTYGTQTYGTPRVGSTYGGQARIWSLDNWGEDLLAAPNGEALYWWSRQSGPDSRAILRVTAPGNIEHMLVGPDDRHVIALGTNLLSADLATVTGQQDKMFMRWCVGDDFDDWVPRADAQEANDAGSKRLDLGSRLITAVKTRTAIVIFSDIALYAVSLIGGVDVYQVTPVGGAVRIIAKKAAIDVFGTVYYMTTQGFGFFDGSIHDLPCDIADFVFGSPEVPRMNRQMQSKIWAELRVDFFEIRWHFPSVDSDENDSIAVYNWQSQCWYVSRTSLARECSLDKNAFYGVPVGFNDTAVLLEETGNDVNGEEGLFNFLQTWEGEFSMSSRHDVPQNQTLWSNASGSMHMLIHSLIPDFKELEGSVIVQCIGRDRTKDPLVYGDRLTVDSTTGQVDPQFSQRRVALYHEASDMGVFWRMDFWQAYATPHGRTG